MAGLSARGARVTLRYAEGAEQLADALAQPGPELAQCGRQLGALPAIGPSTAVRARAARIQAAETALTFAGSAALEPFACHSTPGPPLNINIPNFITLGRVMSVPVIFWLLLSGQSKIAFFVFRLRRHQRRRRRLPRQALRLDAPSSAPISIRWPTSC